MINLSRGICNLMYPINSNTKETHVIVEPMFCVSPVIIQNLSVPTQTNNKDNIYEHSPAKTISM